jgi:hypothetical protein
MSRFVWKRIKNTPIAVWEMFLNDERIMTLAYEGVTDSSELPMRDFLWVLYDEREETKGKRRWTFSIATSLGEIRSFAETLAIFEVAE